MMNGRAKSSILAALAGYLLAVTSPGVAKAQTTGFGIPFGDHLVCVKIKDSAPKGSHTLNTNTFVGSNSCKIKLPAKFACISTTKSDVIPTPSGGGPTTLVAGFVCYNVKCAAPFDQSDFAVDDQFGVRGIVPKKAKLFCAPSSPSGAFLDGPAD